MLLPLVRLADGTLREDRSRPPSLAPLAWLGCRTVLSTVAASQWKCRSEDTFKFERQEPTCAIVLFLETERPSGNRVRGLQKPSRGCSGATRRRSSSLEC